LAGGFIVLAALIVFYNSFSGSFIAEDQSAIEGNPSIRHWASALSPPADSTTGGRPLLNLTFALNYAWGGLDVRGYHAFNLLIHALAGLTLFGIVRRTLTSRLAARRSQNSNLKSERLEPVWLALAVAVLWTVHPLQTEAVTFISQRAESLMGLFYLLTLYCFVRGVEERSQKSEVRGQRAEVGGQKTEARGREPEIRGNPPISVRPSVSGLRNLPSAIWLLASVASCLLGAMSKEVIVTAPVMVLLYDRTFVAGSLREAWRLRWRYYLGLACTWALLARLMINVNQQSVGFGQGVTWWNYALTSCRSFGLYLRLAVWPHPLIFDYGSDKIVVRHLAAVVPETLVLAVLLAGTAIALWRRPVAGFVGAWFFLILLPTTSFVPVVLSPTAEHRMYLSLAAVVAVGVLGLHTLIGRRGLILCAAAAVGLGWLSARRNDDYRSEFTLYKDTVAKCPNNERAHTNLGRALMNMPGGLAKAVVEYQTALSLDPNDEAAHYDYGIALTGLPNQWEHEISEYETAIRLKPGHVDAHINLGVALKKTGRIAEAIDQLEQALRIEPDNAKAHNDLGQCLALVPGRLQDAIREYQKALQLEPDYVQAHNNLGAAFARTPGRLAEAIPEYEAALKIEPNSVAVQFNLALALTKLGRESEALAYVGKVLKSDPDYGPARQLLKQLRGKPF
jgi:tetratricopeptide (TPR) repeat protein